MVIGCAQVVAIAQSEAHVAPLMAPPLALHSTFSVLRPSLLHNLSNFSPTNLLFYLYHIYSYLYAIRYLQQLVSAQATRNRDLEQQLHSFRGSSGSSSSGMLNGNGTNPEDEMLMLHEEVGDFNLVPSLGMHNGGGGNNHSHSRKRFSGFELESVAEMDQDTEHGDHNDEDHDMERPSTSGTGASPLSEGTVSDEQDGEDGQQQQPQEEERGRKGRDGRPMGLGGAMKTEEGMETS